MRTLSGGLCALVLGVAGLGQAQAAAALKPLTHETLWMMKRVGAPVVSPTGEWALYTVTEPSYEPDKAVSDLWLAPVDGRAPPHRITHTRAAEGGAAWSPDGRRIAFTSRREGDAADQVYVLDLALGGDARRVTDVVTGAANPRWRPDGGAILFESAVYPGAADDDANRRAAAERKARKYNLRTYEHFPIRYWNEWLDDRRPTLMVQSLEPGAKARDILSGSRLAQGEGFSGVQGETSISLSPVWSPDGREVVFSATTERWNAAFAEVGYGLYRVAADGGGEPRLVSPAKGDFSDPAFSPDGRWLYVRYERQGEEVYHLSRLSRLPWPGGGEPALVARGFDRDTARFALTPDGRTVYLLAPEASHENLYRVAAEGGTPELVIAPETGGYTALSIADKTSRPVLVAQYGSSVLPPEVVRIDPAARRHAPLTQVNAALAATIDWAPPKAFAFTSAKGREIHSLVVTPPAFDPARRYPVLVFIHGGAASSNPDQIGLRWNYHLLAASGYVILMTDYTGSTGYGEAFSQAIKLDPLKTPGDEINQALDEALKRYPFMDGSRVCAGGASYGGHLANWLEATTTRYRCLISHAGEVDLLTQWGESDGIYGREVTNGGPPWETSKIWREQSPISYGAAWKTPMLLSIGERDYRVPLGNTLEAWAVLQRQKVPSRLLVWPDAWHWITKPEDSRKFYQEVDAWLAEHLKDAPRRPPAGG